MPMPVWVAEAQAREQARRERAEKPIEQFQRGLLTVGELAHVLVTISTQ